MKSRTVERSLYHLKKTNHILLLLFLIFGGLYLASTFLIPLTFAAILAMLMAPLSAKLEVRGLNKAVAAFLCILLLVLFFVGLGFLLSTQVASFIEDIPQIEKQINQQVRSMQAYVQETFGVSPQEQEEAVKEGSGSGGVGGMVVGFINSFTGIMASSLLVLVYIFLLLYYRSRFPRFILKVVRENEKERTRKIINESSQVAQQYLIGRGILLAILAILYSIGLTIIGLDNAILLSVIVAFLSIIPYFGNIIGFALLMLIALAQGGGTAMFIGVFIMFTVVQTVENYILEPLVVGAKVDIHPFFTVVIIIIGGHIWGVAGMILAIPMLGIAKIIFSHIDSLEPYAYLIGNTRDEDSRKTSSP